MKSGHCLKELNSYIDNQLSGKDIETVEEHLSQCKECSMELARLRIVSERLKDWPAPALDERFDQVVRERIVRWELDRGQVKMKKKTMFVLIPSGALAGILVIAFFNTMLQGNFRKAGTIENEMKAQVNHRYSAGEDRDARSATARVNYADAQRIVAPQIHDYSALASPEKSSVLYGMLGTSNTVNGSEARDNNALYLQGAFPEQKRTYEINRAFSAQSPAASLAEGTSYQDGPVILIQPVLPATADGEKVIRTGYVNLEVISGQDTYKKTQAICKELGGYLAASRFYKDASGRESGTITLRIPKDKFNQAIDWLSALGKVEHVNTDSRDVGQEYANLKAELDAQMVVYNKILEALQKKQATIPEAMRLESELTPVLRKIAEFKNKIEYLNNAIRMATINVSFYESAVSVKALKDSGRYIKESLLASGISAVKFVATALPTLIVLVIFGSIVIALVVLVKAWLIRLFKRG